MIRYRPKAAALSAAIASALVAGVAGPALAQSSSILLNNAANTEIVLQDGTSVQVDPISGNLTATPLDPQACTGTASCDDVQVDVTSFTASPSSVSQGTSISLGWASRGAYDCTGTGLTGTTWNGTGKLPQGNQSVSTASLTPNSYTANIECQNGPVTDLRSVSFTVVAGGGSSSQQCIDAGRVPPAGLIRDTTALSDIFNRNYPDPTLTWADMFTDPFPSIATPYWKTQQDQYISLEFTTAGVPTGTRGRLQLDNPQSSFNFGLTLLTFSECPGDFTNQVDADCKKLLNNSGINWTVTSATGVFNRCELKPNTTYYLNALHTTRTSDPFVWECGIPPGTIPRPADCGDKTSAYVE